MFSGVTARESVTCVAVGSSVSRTRDGSATRTLTSARVLRSVKSSWPSSASIARNSGSVASGLKRLARWSRCHRASTVAGERLNPSRGRGRWRTSGRCLPGTAGRSSRRRGRASLCPCATAVVRRRPGQGSRLRYSGGHRRVATSSSSEGCCVRESVHTSRARTSPATAAITMAAIRVEVLGMRTEKVSRTPRVVVSGR